MPLRRRSIAAIDLLASRTDGSKIKVGLPRVARADPCAPCVDLNDSHGDHPRPRLKVGTEGHHPVEVHCQAYGTGKPTVLIRGWPLSGHSWAAQVPAHIAAGCRVIAYDRRGFGGSSQPWSGYDYDRMAFLDGFTKAFFSAGGKLMVSEAQRVHALDIAAFASPKGTLDCIGAFSYTDFRADLAKIKLPTLVIHGDSDAIVPLEVSGARTHRAIPGSILSVIKGAPHGFNLSHAAEFNEALLAFLAT